MDLCVEIRTLLSKYALGRVNFVSRRVDAENKSEDDLRSRVWGRLPETP
jgi:hypothetical protein